MRAFLKFIIRVLHNILSKSALTTRIYFKTLNLLVKSLPDYKFKSIIFGCIARTKWPQIGLAAQKIRLAGSSLSIKIIPHLIEPDSAAIIFKTLKHEKGVFEYLEQHIKDYDAVIEIGANVGLFTISFAKWFTRWGKPENNIFSFEASRRTYLRLLRNLQLNKIKGAQTFNLAVGEKNDFVNFYEPAGHLTNSSLYRDFAEIFSTSLTINKTYMISGSLLEGLVRDSRRVLLKINAEGAEYAILQSMKDFIVKKTPAIIIEVLELYQNQLNQLEFLLSGQYSFFNITDQGLESRDRFVAGYHYSYLLLPATGK
jgi:FkbM family methyltransferase